MTDSTADRGVGPVVSAAHLADGRLPPLSELEFALTMANHAFHRWMVRAMAAAGVPGLSPLEVLVLHHVHHRERQKTLADLCLVLAIEDTHTVTYALKKLEAQGLVRSGRRGKEKTVAITAAGEEASRAYRSIREGLLVASVVETGLDGGELSKLAALLRALSGQYDQAARAAAAM
jgi:predicted MarR family transcription regulator